ENISKHILPVSANLLGLCFILINFLQYWKMSKSVDMVLDNLVGVAVVLFLISSVLSYMAMRAKKNEVVYERIADYVFLSGLFFMTGVSLMIAFEML
ncbi:MAG: hypothetical protein PH343_03055, partial [Nitrospira sp.]|nr:hypothetical protein [Nitrospira sp.]